LVAAGFARVISATGAGLGWTRLSAMPWTVPLRNAELIICSAASMIAVPISPGISHVTALLRGRLLT